MSRNEAGPASSSLKTLKLRRFRLSLKCRCLQGFLECAAYCKESPSLQGLGVHNCSKRLLFPIAAEAERSIPQAFSIL